MCKRKTYERFKKIYDYIQKSGAPVGYGSSFKYSFKTKLGIRDVITFLFDGNIALYYMCKKDSLEPLFQLCIYKDGSIQKAQSKIDEPAIFAAIYEIECIINDKKQKERDNLLERLFESIDEYSFMNKFNFTQYR